VTRLLARLRSQRGFTIVEVLVAASVGSVVMLAIFSMLDGALKQSTGVNARVDSTQRGRVAMETITRELRSQVCWTPSLGTTPAVSLAYGDPYKVTFYAFNGTTQFRPERRTIFWDTNSDSIQETVEPGVGTPVTSFGTPVTRTILTNVKPPVVNGTSGPVFEYMYLDTTKPAGQQQQLLTGNPLTAANLARTAVINVRFRTNTGVVGNTAGITYTSYESQAFVRTTDPNGLAGTTNPDCS
jgi:prepilin-type N-terminal cleavage/methylation domain-containing protein